MIIDPRPKVGLQLSVDTSLDFNMFLFLTSFFMPVMFCVFTVHYDIEHSFCIPNEKVR